MQISIANAILVARLVGRSIVRLGLKMWLDFKKSNILGCELVVNGDFATDTDWTKQAGWTISGGVASVDTSVAGTTNLTSTNLSLTIGNRYDVEYYVDSASGSGLRATVGGVNLSNFSVATGNIIKTITAVSTDGFLLVASNSGGTTLAQISNVSVKEVAQFIPDKSNNCNEAKLFSGKALDFNGSTDYVSVNSFAGALSTGDAFTFAIWFNSDKTPATDFFRNILISSGGPAQFTNIFKIGVNPQTSGANVGGIYFDDSQSLYNSTIPLSGGVNYNDGEWHRLVVARVAGSGNQDLTFYVDGSSIGTLVAKCNPLWDNVALFDFGQEWDGGGTSDHFEGKMSNIQVYDYEWTVNDVAYDYANPQNLVTDRDGTSIALSNLKGYWALTEGQGDYAYNSAVGLGSELVENGDFTSGFARWTHGSDWSIVSDAAFLDNSNSPANSTLTSDASLTSTLIYKATYTISDYVSGGLALVNGNVSIPSTNGTHTITFTGQSSFSVKRTGVATTLKIDNVSVKEVLVGIIDGATYVKQEPRILQLGLLDYSISTPLSDEVTLVANPNNPSQDILGTSVRLRENSFNIYASGYAEVADANSLDFGTGNFTIETWVKASYLSQGSSLNSIIALGGAMTDVGSAGIGVFNTTSKFAGYVGSIPFYSNDVFNSGDWYHVVITRDSGLCSMYVDSVAQTETRTTNANITNSLVKYIGRDSLSTRFYSNLIGESRLYNRALTQSEVKQNFNVGKASHSNSSSFSGDFGSDFGG